MFLALADYFLDTETRQLDASEAKSAALLEREVRRTDLARFANRANELVLLTARHGRLSGTDVDADAGRFLDCDLAVSRLRRSDTTPTKPRS